MTIQDRGAKKLEQLLADPERRARVADIENQTRQMDRVYDINLSLIRAAANMTQAELATQLGLGQGAVSKVENQHDMLLSTFANYLRAAGAHAHITVTVAGHTIEYNLDTFNR